jgi:hypothetical protein
MPAKRADVGVDSARQLELFGEAQAEPERNRAELLVAKDGLGRGQHAGGDRAVLKTLEATLADARASADDRPALVVLAPA